MKSNLCVDDMICKSPNKIDNGIDILAPLQQNLIASDFKSNYALENLMRVFKNSDADSVDVHAYIVRTAKANQDNISQLGNSPNFEGGVITLTCCKHHMRSSTTIKEGDWVAGVTSSNVNNAISHQLFYLARIKHCFKSFKELWDNVSSDVSSAKSASIHPLGDMYEPKSGRRDFFKHESYKGPCNNHVHLGGKFPAAWEQDIEKQYSRMKSRPKLVLFDAEASYVWLNPKVKVNGLFDKNGRGKRRLEMGDFLNLLSEV